MPRRRLNDRGSADASKRLPLWLVAGAGALVVCFVYVPVVGAPFVNWDDPVLVTGNARIQEASAGGALALFVPSGHYSYQPARDLSHMLDWAVWGDQPAGHRTMNLLLHLAAGWLVFILLCRLWPVAEPQVPALCVMLLFLVHPVAVEVVMWVSSRKYCLLAVFSLASLCCVTEQDRRWLAGASVLGILAMLSSPFGVVLPVIAAGVLWGQKRSLRGVIPLAVGAVLVAVLVLMAGGRGTHTRELVAQLQGFGLAVFHLLVPSDLCVVYPSLPRRPFFVGLGGVALVGGAALTGWAVRANQRALALAAGWLLVWLAPTFALALPYTTSDRYLYLAGLGPLTLGVVWLCRATWGRWACCGLILFSALLASSRAARWQSSIHLWQDATAKNPGHNVSWLNLGTAYLDAGQPGDAVAALERCREIDPENAQMRLNLMMAYLQAGRWDAADALLDVVLTGTTLEDAEARGQYAFARADWDVAERALREALAFPNPGLAPRLLLSQTLLQQKEFGAALENLPQLSGRKEVACLRGDIYLASGNLDQARLAYSAYAEAPEARLGLARVSAAAGREREAVAAAQALLRDHPQYRPARELEVSLAVQWAQKNQDLREVERIYKAALADDPDHAEWHFRLGELYRQNGAADLAVSAYRKALPGKPRERDYIEGMIATSLGQWEQGRAALVRYVARVPHSADAQMNLGALYFKLEQFPEALAHLRIAVRLAPDSAVAWSNLGAAAFRAEAFPEALEAYQRCLKIDPTHDRASRIVDGLQRVVEASEKEN